ncbi:zinc finger protein 354A-like [Dermacentor albipictus]|uniref:zinc finger protein 354A-like n=1 Tax=Dermacentor albipictus TaxID=60249 RepID=UPI0038FCD424
MHVGPTEDVPPDGFPWQKVSSLQSVADSGQPFAGEPPGAVPRAGEPICPVCYREFKMRCHMVVHMRSVHNVNPTTVLHMPYRRNQQVLQKGHPKRKTSAVQKRHQPNKAAGAPAGTVSKASTPKAKQKPQPGDAAQQPPSSSHFTGGIGAAFPCKWCGRSFDSLRGLLKHEQVHQWKRAAANRPLFKCSRCGSIYKYLGGLVRHRLACAKGAAPRQPPREKAAAKGEGGDGTKTFGCNKCGAVFDNQVSLARHKGSHTRKARAASGSRAPCQCNLPSCKVCGRHQKAGGSVAADHSAAYTCHLCSQAFRTKEKLSTHLITKHFKMSV